MINGIYYGPDIVRHGRRQPKFPNEVRQMARINAGIHLLTDSDLRETRDDWNAEVAREIADRELDRRAGLSAHQIIAIRRRLPGVLIGPAPGEGVVISGDGWIVYASNTGADDAWEVYPAMRDGLLDRHYRQAIRAVEEALKC